MIPVIGFGTYRVHDQEVFENAIKQGYVHFDTAELYKNEHLVKNAIDKCAGDKKIHITTKISKKAILNGEIEKSFYERLELWNYIDLLLLHIPSDDCKKDWEQLCELYEKNRDRVGKIGVSNYDIKHLEQIKDSKIKPYCDQIELSPFYTRPELVKYLNDNKIIIVSHTTLTRGEKFNDPRLQTLSQRYKASVANVLLEWAYRNGYVVIPRTSKLDHMIENKIIKECIHPDDLEYMNSFNENYCITKVKV